MRAIGHRKPVRRAGGPGSRRGLSLLEVLIAVSVFGITMAGLTGTQLTSIALSRANQDLSLATDAAQSVLEELRAEPDFHAIYLRWNANPDDDPAGTVGPGNAFDVRGLEPAPDDPDGRVGEVIFPGDGMQLLENLDDRLLGTPRDLDLDGVIDGQDQSIRYHLLPVLVRVRWLSARGVMQAQIVGTLAQR